MIRIKAVGMPTKDAGLARIKKLRRPTQELVLRLGNQALLPRRRKLSFLKNVESPSNETKLPKLRSWVVPNNEAELSSHEVGMPQVRGIGMPHARTWECANKEAGMLQQCSWEYSTKRAASNVGRCVVS